MSKIFPEYKRSTVYSIISVMFHFVVVVVPLLLSGGTGEAGKTVGWIVLFFDFPLFFPLSTNLPNALKFFTDSMGAVWYFAFFGTILYALGGWVIGYAWNKYLQKR